MSSDTKDARWHLAMGFVEGVAEMDWSKLTYEQHQKVLDCAQMLIEIEPEAVAFWARMFRSDRDDTKVEEPWALPRYEGAK